MLISNKNPEEIIEEKGLKQISDDSALEKIIDDIITSFPDETERYRQGENKLRGFFVGQVMQKTKGKANPELVNELLTKKLEA